MTTLNMATMSIMVSEASGNESVEKDCPICMEVVDLSVNCLVTECGHTFHTSCFLNNVLHNGFGCPYCRRVLVDFGRDEVVEMRRREIERQRNEEQVDEEVDILNQGFYEDEEVEDQGAAAAPQQQDIENIDMVEIPEAQIEEIEEVGGPPVRNWLTEGLMEMEGEGVGGDEDEGMGMEIEVVDEMMEREQQMSRNNMMPSPYDLAVELQCYGYHMIDYVRIFLDAHYQEEYRGIIGDYNLRRNIHSLRTSIATLMQQYREEARIELDVWRRRGN